MIKGLRKPISLLAFSCIVSLGTLVLYNLPFFEYVADNTNETTGGKLFLLGSLAVIMLVLNFMMTYLVMFLLRMVGRILLAILSIINATAVYLYSTPDTRRHRASSAGRCGFRSLSLAYCRPYSACCSQWSSGVRSDWLSAAAVRWPSSSPSPRCISARRCGSVSTIRNWEDCCSPGRMW